jgi:hypothetical protein
VRRLGGAPPPTPGAADSSHLNVQFLRAHAPR